MAAEWTLTVNWLNGTGPLADDGTACETLLFSLRIDEQNRAVEIFKYVTEIKEVSKGVIIRGKRNLKQSWANQRLVDQFNCSWLCMCEYAKVPLETGDMRRIWLETQHPLHT